MRLLTEVQHVIHTNLLLCGETIAYLCQCMLNHVQRYSNVRSADFNILLIQSLILRTDDGDVTSSRTWNDFSQVISQAQRNRFPDGAQTVCNNKDLNRNGLQRII